MLRGASWCGTMLSPRSSGPPMRRRPRRMRSPFGENPRNGTGSTPPTRPFAHLADVTAELAALDAFTAAEDASGAVGYSDNFINGAVGDYERLLSLKLGRYPRAGQPIDPSPTGPLGALWPEQPPRYDREFTNYGVWSHPTQRNGG